MNSRAALVSLLSAVLISGRGASSRRFVQAALALLLLCVALLPASIMAEEAKRTVKLDGKTVFLPEIKLTRKINPVTTFLYVGSWTSAGKSYAMQKSLGMLDLKNNTLVLESPEKLLGKSKPGVVKRGDLNSFLDGITWGKRQVTQFAFKAISGRRQPAMIDMYADADVAVFLNEKLASEVSAGSVLASGGRGYLPIMLEAGENIINIKQFSKGAPRIEVAVRLDHLHDLQAAWQAQNGLLKKLVCGQKERVVVEWSPELGGFSVSAEVRDVMADNVVFQKKSVFRGEALGDASKNFAPGIYEAAYKTQNESASEFFIVGNSKDIFSTLKDNLSKYNTNSKTKLNIEAQLRRAQILLADNNYNISDRQWQEKLTYTFRCLTEMENRLKDGVADIAKNQPGLHIRGFISKADDSSQFYMLFVPSDYKPGFSVPLLVIPATAGTNATRLFIEGPVMADYRGARLWAQYAEKHGFAVLWPGYRNLPMGYTYESVHINEAIQAVEKDYNIDPQRISVYATCGAGYFAGRLLSEYDRRFAAVVFDRAAFDISPDKVQNPPPSILEWLQTVSPPPRVIGNRNLKIFVMHDDTRPAGHGPLALSIQFLEEAKKSRDDVVSHISKRPMAEIERMDMVFSWLVPCKNENPDETRSRFLSKAGYAGPIMEIFATPFIVVEGTHSFNDEDRQNIQHIMESLKNDYGKYFHGAECPVMKDDEVTQDDIKTHSLILVGDPVSNSAWGKLQPHLLLNANQDNILYKNKVVAGKETFEAIVPHPFDLEKYVLLVGAGDWRNLKLAGTSNLFNAWYDCLIYSPALKIISKLDNANLQHQP